MGVDDKLKDAVFAEWVYSVKSGMGGSIRDMLRQYGFTGDFTGLDKHFDSLRELEDHIKYNLYMRKED
jgi:hypothetical protein